MKTLKILNPYILVTGVSLLVVWCWTAWAQISGTMDSAPDGSVTDGWRSVAVNADGQTGSVNWQGAGQVRILSQGSSIGGTKSSFQTADRLWSGDCEISARLVAMTTNGQSQAGLMIRSAEGGGAPYVFFGVGRSGFMFTWRAERDGPTAMQKLVLSAEVAKATSPALSNEEAARRVDPPVWLKLIRRGDAFSSYISKDGIRWEIVEHLKLNIGSTASVGMVAAGARDSAVEAIFDEVRVQSPPPLTQGVQGRGVGLKMAFYDLHNPDKPFQVLSSSVVKFAKKHNQTLGGLAITNMAVHFEGFLQARFSEEHALMLASDGRARLWLDGKLLMDHWQGPEKQASTRLVQLEAGKKYALRVEYYNSQGPGALSLSWKSPSLVEQVVPREQLSEAIEDVAAVDSHALTQEELDGLSDPAKLALTDQDPLLISPWLTRDVGLNFQPGSVRMVGNGFGVEGVGGNFRRASSEGFRFVYRVWTGDFEMTARMQDLEGGLWRSESGLMVRENVAPGSRTVYVGKTPEHGVRQLVRNEVQGSMVSYLPKAAQVDRGKSDSWVRIVRRGDFFATFSPTFDTGHLISDQRSKFFDF